MTGVGRVTVLIRDIRLSPPARSRLRCCSLVWRNDCRTKAISWFPVEWMAARKVATRGF